MERREARIQGPGDATREAYRCGNNCRSGAGRRTAARTGRQRRPGAQAGIPASHAGARPAACGWRHVDRTGRTGRSSSSGLRGQNAGHLCRSERRGAHGLDVRFHRNARGRTDRVGLHGVAYRRVRREGECSTPVEEFPLVGNQHFTHQMKALFLLFISTSLFAQSPPPVEIELMTYPEIYSAIHEQGKTTVIIYNGGTEQRGPHAVLGGHTLMARVVAPAIARKLGNALVAPVLPFSPAGSHLNSKRARNARIPGKLYSAPEQTNLGSIGVDRVQ